MNPEEYRLRTSPMIDASIIITRIRMILVGKFHPKYSKAASWIIKCMLTKS
jgi:hypothetical protein